MKRMWKEYDPNSKIQLKFNRYGQPCGLKICKLTSFIGCLVRGKEISLAHKNWSKVDKSHKEKLWTTIKVHRHNLHLFASWFWKLMLIRNVIGCCRDFLTFMSLISLGFWSQQAKSGKISKLFWRGSTLILIYLGGKISIMAVETGFQHLNGSGWWITGRQMRDRYAVLA